MGERRRGVWVKLTLIALAGAVGTLARFWLQGFVQRLTGGGFPWGTFAVNVLGCFLFGVVWSMAEERLVISGETRLIILTGFMGAFTTFSTFAFETGEQLRESQWLYAAGNVGGQVVLGVLALFLGMALGRQF
jgi:fluoride exporter